MNLLDIISQYNSNQYKYYLLLHEFNSGNRQIKNKKTDNKYTLLLHYYLLLFIIVFDIMTPVNYK